ncbi:hypothetical protein DXG03_004166 [Asterophora parasitica]|uniref:Uncharacterized protein n=1 Tax=Asterophora parasitica TaxID=117018 RepID=A0A9P7G6S6_9AGAR|nr:hypothetical protein DXG03_004166 [Asterophora parasitica]
MNEATDKPRWHEKVFDDAITSKWKEEIQANTDFTNEMFDWCIAELRYKIPVFEKTGAISVYNGDVVKSDTTVPPALQEALKAAVVSLENVPDRHKDWHPGSDGKVLDLVHPSLFPLVYGKSRILETSRVGLEDCITRCGEGETIPVPDSSNGPIGIP